MNKKIKYIVKVRISYVKFSFSFDTSSLACHFMDMFLDHMSVDDDISIHMERETVEEAETEEEEIE